MALNKHLVTHDLSEKPHHWKRRAPRGEGRPAMNAKRTRKGEVRPFAKSDIGDVLDLTDMLIELEKGPGGVSRVA
jgi:hypothetical protein